MSNARQNSDAENNMHCEKCYTNKYEMNQTKLN